MTDVVGEVPIVCDLWQQKPKGVNYKCWGRFTCVVSNVKGGGGQKVYQVQGRSMLYLPLGVAVKVGRGWLVLRPVNPIKEEQ